MSPSGRRLHLLCGQVLAAPCATATATTTAVEAEVKEIIAVLGPAPLVAMSKKMLFIMLSKDLPPLHSRDYDWTDPQKKADLGLVERILKLCPSAEDDPEENGAPVLVGTKSPQEDAMHVVKAMLLHAAEALDESHDGLEKVFLRERFADSDARVDAAYAHMLLHRQEGQCLSPEGTGADTGFTNAKFWINNTETGGKRLKAGKGWGGVFTQDPKALAQHTFTPHPLYPEVLAAARKFAKGNPKLEKMVEEQHVKVGGWRAKAFVDFCDQAFQENDKESVEFVRQLYNAEWRLLLEYSAKKAGIQL